MSPGRWILLLLVLGFLGLASLHMLAQNAGRQDAEAPAGTVAVKALPVHNPQSADAPMYAKESLIVLEHTSVIRFTADGLGERSETMRVRIQSDAAVRTLGVLNFAYASSFEHVEIVYLRVRKPDGSVVSTPDEDAQDMPTDVTRTAPMYSDTREKQVPVKSLSVGDTLEYQVKIVRTVAEAPGEFWYAQNFLLGNVVLAEDVELRVPQKKYVQVTSAEVKPDKKDEGEETVYRWHTSQLLAAPATEDEKKVYEKKLKAQTKQPSIMLTTFHSWADVGAWYRGLSRERAGATPAVRAKADEVTRGLTTDEAKIRALYAYVSTQIRYISISFGVGRYQPHEGDTVLANQYGDCKDKHTLLAAMLKAEGIEASPVLIGSSLKLNPDVPTPAQFDHVITVVELGKERIWLDATPEVAPYRMLMQPLRDKQALMIPADGPAVLVTTPADPPFASFYRMTATGTLDSAGTIKGHIDATTRGDTEVYLREGLHQTARAQWQDLFQNVSYAQGFAGTVSNVDAMLPEKTAEPFHYSYDYERKEFGDWANHRIVALLPPVSLVAPGDDKPDEPLEMLAIGKEELRSTITLPDGYSARLPEAVTLTSDVADYSAKYSLKGQQLEVERSVTIKMTKIPPAKWEDYKDLQKKAMEDYGQFIQLYSGDEKDQAEAGNPEAQRLVQEAFEDIQEHDLSKAADALDTAEKVNPQQWGLWAGRAFLEQQKRNAEPALEDYRKEIKLHPHNKGAYEAMIWTEMHLGHKDEVLPTLQQMVTAFPDDPAVKVSLGAEWMSRQEYAKAVPVFAEAVKSKPDNKAYALQLGNAQLKAGMKSDGEATLKGVLKGSDDNAGFLNDAAYELADAGLDLQLSEESCRHSLELQDAKLQSIDLNSVSNVEFGLVNLLHSTWDSMGWILYKEGKLQEAATYLKPSWVLSQSSVVGYHLGKVYEAMGKEQEALETYELALRTQAPGSGGESEAKEMKERALQLAAGQKLDHGSKETEELLKMRTVELPEFVKGYNTADFNLVWSANGFEDAAFVTGDDSLRPAIGMLKKLKPAQPFPRDSKAKVVRRGIMACSDITKSCQMVLMYPPDAVTASASDRK